MAARSFDVDLAPGAVKDLEALAKPDVEQIIRILRGLRDTDLFDFERLAWPPGPSGTWVLLGRRHWRFLCQWNKGTPNLWHMGLGRGMLTVERIKRDDYIQQVLGTKPT